VRFSITRLCSFFNSIGKKVIDPLNLEELQQEIVIVLCQLEMFFSPSFFDIMVHLIVHLVREIILCALVYLRWMYPVERYMKILKGDRPKASIIERYILEEAIEFCSKYIFKTNSIGVLDNCWHLRRIMQKSSKCIHVESKSRKEVMQAHLYILNNTNEVNHI